MIIKSLYPDKIDDVKEIQLDKFGGLSIITNDNKELKVGSISLDEDKLTITNNNLMVSLPEETFFDIITETFTSNDLKSIEINFNNIKGRLEAHKLLEEINKQVTYNKEFNFFLDGVASLIYGSKIDEFKEKYQSKLNFLKYLDVINYEQVLSYEFKDNKEYLYLRKFNIEHNLTNNRVGLIRKNKSFREAIYFDPNLVENFIFKHFDKVYYDIEFSFLTTSLKELFENMFELFWKHIDLDENNDLTLTAKKGNFYFGYISFVGNKDDRELQITFRLENDDVFDEFKDSFKKYIDKLEDMRINFKNNDMIFKVNNGKMVTDKIPENVNTLVISKMLSNNILAVTKNLLDKITNIC